MQQREQCVIPAQHSGGGVQVPPRGVRRWPVGVNTRKTGSTLRRLITMSSEEDRDMATGNMHRKFREVWTCSYSAPHCKRCTSYDNSVCLSICLSVCPSVSPSVTRRYCVETTARSTVQFALSDIKMSLVL